MFRKYWRTIYGTNTWFKFNKPRWPRGTRNTFYKNQARNNLMFMITD